ncbi:MAG: imidazole glycerol phosphate synthase subunit HisH [Acetivibrionales bacterium]
MIAIIDYGVGNLRSVEKAFEFIGYEACVSSNKDFILNADAVVLPGVGAFADAMQKLEKSGMLKIVREATISGRPFLGICLGMQMLFEHSQEGGEMVKGLDIFKGSIKQLPGGVGLKVPHMGWNCLDVKNDCILFRGLPGRSYVYFVHSYYLEAGSRDIVSAVSDYGIEFDAAVARENVFGTQFHPEKSGEVGLKILKNWASLI